MERGIVVRLDKEDRREPVMMRWGFVPSWSKDDKAGAAMINAKAETVAGKPAHLGFDIGTLVRRVSKLPPKYGPRDDSFVCYTRHIEYAARTSEI